MFFTRCFCAVECEVLSLSFCSLELQCRVILLKLIESGWETMVNTIINTPTSSIYKQILTF
jgi:hypothetical protein